MKNKKIWRVINAQPDLQYILHNKLNISPVLAKILLNRGISTVEEARYYLSPSLEGMFSPHLMAGMGEAVDRIARALEQNEKILVYGDYDADGTTGTALLVLVLRRLGARAGYYIPHREEGYGLHLEALESAHRQGYTLVVTVDCGISAAPEVAAAREAGYADIVITDHHEPPKLLPQAVALVNPKRHDCSYPFKELAGVGVALKLAQALLEKYNFPVNAWHDYLELACLGTVADVVPLRGENRAIVKHGLSLLANTLQPGLRALKEVSGFRTEGFSLREISFGLVPRINAAGRMGDASLAVELFLCQDPALAGEMAQQLNRGNQERQAVEGEVLSGALALLQEQPELLEDEVLVLAAPGWHQGVIGIAASRLVDKYYKPVLMISLEDGRGKGSGRSVPGFNLYECLNHCRQWLLGYGGHTQAAGFTLEEDKIFELRQAINHYARNIAAPREEMPELSIDDEISLSDLSEELVGELDLLAPFGYGNPGPLLACREVHLKTCREVGKNGGHLKLCVEKGGVYLDGIAFKLSHCMDEIAAAGRVDLAFLPSINEWKGRRSLQAEVADIKPAGERWASTCLSLPGAPGEILGAGDKDAVAPGHGLLKLGPAAFVPEFIYSWLCSYIKNNPNLGGGNLPYCNLLKYYCPLPSPGDLSPGAAVVVDDRGSGSKNARLAEICLAGGKTLVVADSPHRTVELALYLGSLGLDALYLHPGLNIKAAGVQPLPRNQGVIVMTPGLMGSVSGELFDRVVFYNFPFFQGEWLEALGLVAQGNIHLLYERQVPGHNMKLLDTVAPGREELALLYTFLKGNAGGRLAPVDAVKHFERQGFIPDCHHFLLAGMIIFTELGLIECQPGDEGSINYKIKAPAGAKRELNSSKAFVLGQEIKNATLSWWQGLVCHKKY